MLRFEDLLHRSIGLVGDLALGGFLITMVVGVPSFMVYAARLGPEASSKIRRLNDRLFWFAAVVFYTGFACTILYQFIAVLRDC